MFLPMDTMYCWLAFPGHVLQAAITTLDADHLSRRSVRSVSGVMVGVGRTQFSIRSLSVAAVVGALRLSHSGKRELHLLILCVDWTALTGPA